MTKPAKLWICLILAISVISLPFLAVQANDNDGQFELGDPGIMPNTFWYNFEVMKERVVLIFTFSNLSKAKKTLNLSTERIAELKTMAEKNDISNSKKVINRYISFLDELKMNLDDCNKNSNQVKKEIETTKKTTTWQIEELNKIKQTAPQELNQDINNAIQKSGEIENISCD